MHELEKSGLTLVCIVRVNTNPIKPEAAEAVDVIGNAGINITLVTGDNITIAKRVARETSILRDNFGRNSIPDEVIEGPEYGKIYEEGRH